MGARLGSQWVLSEYSGYSWVLRLFIFEYSGGSQAGTSTRTAPQPSVVHGVGGLAGIGASVVVLVLGYRCCGGLPSARTCRVQTIKLCV